MKQFNENDNSMQIPEDYKPTYIQEQHNNNCQQFFGPIMNCTFTMPSAKENPVQSPQRKNKHNKGTQNKEKQHGLDYPVFSKGSGVTDDHIKAVYKYLAARGWIGTQTSENEFLRLFLGKSNSCEIIWTGQDKQGDNPSTKLGISALYLLFKTLHAKQLITAEAKVGPILETHFVNTDGSFVSNVSNASTTSRNANAVIVHIVELMSLRLNAENVEELLLDAMEAKRDKNDLQDLHYHKKK